MQNEKNGSTPSETHLAIKQPTVTTSNEILNTDAKLRILILTESFHPYTSGIARRFKEIIERLVKQNFLIHVVTGCKVNKNLIYI